MFSHAVEDGLITANPTTGLGKLINKKKDRRDDVHPLTKDEARTFLELVAEHYPRYYPLFLCALRTGLRLGELLALEWGDIDFLRDFIEVHRAYVEGRLTTPKNGKGRRIDMSPQLKKALEALQTERKRETLAKGWKGVPELVFVNDAGKPLDGWQPQRPSVLQGPG